MNPSDLTSIKPHLLRAWLGWCSANRLTPLLVVQPLPYVGLPATVLANATNRQPPQPLVFNLNSQSAVNLGFTAQAIFFTTLFPGQRSPSTVEIPCANWQSLRIPEIGQKVDLGFIERLPGSKRPDAMPWPEGSGGVIIPANPDAKIKPQGLGQDLPKPSLVWSNTSK